MTDATTLRGHNIIAFVPIVNLAKATSFYRDTLGLRLVQDEAPFALVFDANGIMLRLTPVGELSPAPWTVLGWEVAEIKNAVRELTSSGVRFERYEQMKQDEHGIWTSPTGAMVAWFKDPDGNVLSISEHSETMR
jgi:catechol 2,3-dioxygenase-like lactoylglutathione lyase family enzyme